MHRFSMTRIKGGIRKNITAPKIRRIRDTNRKEISENMRHKQERNFGFGTTLPKGGYRFFLSLSRAFFKSTQSTHQNALSDLVKNFKFALKYTITSLLNISVFNDHHQGALSVPN